VEDAVATIDEVLTFWFGDAELETQGEYREHWFKKNAEFDTEIAARFGVEVEAAAAGAFDTWAATAAGSLALCILLDQFPRNLYRGTAKAFATDAKARNVAAHALDRCQDQAMAPVKGAFLYLPFEHGESLADQQQSVELFRALGNESQYRYALEHYYVISRFGRFPTRNKALGRADTPEETAFIATFSSF
jgi:uncharacterized protein (DUF924 family)